MSDYLAKEGEDFFMNKLKDSLSEDEKRQMLKKYDVPNNFSTNAPLTQVALGEGRNLEIATYITKQFLDEFGGIDNTRLLGVKINVVLTSRLNSDIANWPETKKFYRRLKQMPTPPLDTWNENVGLLVNYSKSFLSTFVQEWYHAFLIPRLKARSTQIRMVTIGVIGFIIYALFNFFQ